MILYWQDNAFFVEKFHILEYNKNRKNPGVFDTPIYFEPTLL